jgi:hypothetical protein
MGPQVWLCTVTGTRKEGDQCHPTGRVREIACARGLICNQYFCGRPCVPGDPTTCPAHFVCAGGLNGPSCVPSCADTGCPPGEECLPSERDASYCARIVKGWNCFEKPCPAGQKCTESWVSAERTVSLSCETPCGPDKICPEGRTCLGAVCERTCSRSRPESCLPGERCAWYPVEKVWACAAE